MEMDTKEARVDVEIMCQFDDALGGYGVVIRYDLERINEDWKVASKEILIES